MENSQPKELITFTNIGRILSWSRFKTGKGMQCLMELTDKIQSTQDDKEMGGKHI